MQTLDLSGRRFGSLLAVRREGHLGKKVAWLCRCDCGQQHHVRSDHLTLGKVRSCGCQQGYTLHGEYKTPLYAAWGNMWGRTRNHPSYVKQGISVDPAWSDYTVFRDWALANGFSPGFHLDRIRTGGGYGPDNCQWLTPEAHYQKHSKSQIMETTR